VCCFGAPSVLVDSLLGATVLTAAGGAVLLRSPLP
jgi:hypothetical protein